jgi:hypothetical protein
MANVPGDAPDMRETGNVEEKSETGPGSCTVEEPDYCDNHGQVGFSVTADESDVISVSRNRPKKLKKKKHKKSSSSKGRRESEDVPLADYTDGETSDTPTSRPMKKTKSKRIKKKNPEEEGDTERRQRKAKKKGSKKPKKREKSCTRRSDIEHISWEALQSDSVPLDQDRGLYPNTTSNTTAVEPHDFPPDLHSDTSSSDLPYPGDLYHDFEHNGDSTSSSVERYETPPVSISSLLGRNAPRKDHDECPFLASSLESMSRPPQSIPGSLAQEIAGDTLDPESAIEFSAGVRHKSRRWPIYMKPRAIFGVGVLLVVTIVMIFAL